MGLLSKVLNKKKDKRTYRPCWNQENDDDYKSK